MNKKPTRILELNGAFRKNPQRKKKRANEPIPDQPIGDPPTRLTKSQKAVWRELVKQTVPGVLMLSDRALLSVVCILLDQFWHANSGECEKLMAGELTQLMRGLSALGLSPVDRTRVSVPPKPEPPDGWDLA